LRTSVRLWKKTGTEDEPTIVPLITAVDGR